MPQTLKEKIIDVVKSASRIDKTSISESTATKGIVLEGALSKLIKDKILVVKVKDGEKIYSIAIYAIAYGSLYRVSRSSFQRYSVKFGQL